MTYQDGKLPFRRYLLSVVAAFALDCAAVCETHAEDLLYRKHWWGFTAVAGWPQFVGIWQDFNEITIFYTGDRW